MADPVTVLQLKSPPGVAVTMAGVTVYTNAAGSGFREIVQVTFPNIDGINDAALAYCRWVDASAANAALAILPVNVKVARLDSLTVTKTLDPGDSITASASADGDIVAIVEIIGRESI